MSDAGPLKALKEENARLKRLLAEQMLDNATLKNASSKKMVTLDAERAAVAHACAAHGVSQLWARQVLSVNRTSVRYRSIRSDDASLREARPGGRRASLSAGPTSVPRAAPQGLHSTLKPLNIASSSLPSSSSLRQA